jgi:hypothetical protein
MFGYEKNAGVGAFSKKRTGVRFSMRILPELQSPLSFIALVINYFGQTFFSKSSPMDPGNTSSILGFGKSYSYKGFPSES